MKMLDLNYFDNKKINLIFKTLLFVMSFLCFYVPLNAVTIKGNVYEYSYNTSKSYQVFTVPKSGMYKLETWGAQGAGRGNAAPGNGGYSTGTVYLERGDILYVYVGGSGSTHQGWNGGGKHGYGTNYYGGGATDIRLISGTWNNSASLNSRIIVAGGGGSVGAPQHTGGHGGLTGINTSGGCGNGGNGATINAAGGLRGGFGYGGNGVAAHNGYGGAGGGGWYGGGGSDPDGSGDDDRGGGGGSSFVWNSKTEVNIPSTYNAPKKYQMSNVSYSTGVRTGDGFARITLLNLDGITSIKINNGDIPIDYSYNKHDYILTVDNDVTNVTFNITAEEGFILTQSNRRTDMTNITSVTNVVTLTDEVTGYTDIYNITVNKVNNHLEERSTVSYGFSYTGNYEKFYVPATGIYTLETWGAEGGSRPKASVLPGKGGYASAEMYLVKGEVLYVYVGGNGTNHAGWNGGGQRRKYYTTGGVNHITTPTYGGGASDIRYGGNSLYNRILVAGGGGSVGAINRGNGGGCGLDSPSDGCGTPGTAGTFTSAGAGGGFGYGGAGTYASDGYGGAGGGGWYGGGYAVPDGSGDDDKGGAGGSNFAFTSANARYVPEGYLVTEKNYLTNAKLYNGGTTFKKPDGSNETGHSGDGYVRITPKLINGVDSVIINNGEISIDFDYSVYEYHISVFDSVSSIDVNFILNEGYSGTPSYVGAYDISNQKTYTYNISVVNDITGLTVNYKLVFHKQSDYLIDGTNSYGYSYAGLPQTFIAPASGFYTFETWGAQGGSRNGSGVGGKGGYSKGEMFLNKGQVLYVYVGANGNKNGWNGGGRHGSGIYGGGATDIRFGGQSLYNRFIVAGGGGSVGGPNTNGGGAGLAGQLTYGSAGGAGTLTGGGSSSGRFGVGGNGTVLRENLGGAGGGGWYGGGGAGTDGGGDDDSAGGGGSNFVWIKANETLVPTEYALTSSQFLVETITKNGNEQFLSPTGVKEVGHSGDGYAKITFSLAYDFEIEIDDYITLDKEFDYDNKEYVGTLDSDDYSIVNFNVTESRSISKVVGDGRQEIHVGDNNYQILITYVNGMVDIFEYNIHREANDIDYLKGIYFDEHPLSEFADKPFSKDVYTYEVNLPYYMDEYDLIVDKGSADQLITNIGHVINKTNKYTTIISVTNETHTSTKTYTLNINVPHSSKIKKLTFNSSGGSVIEFPVPIDETEFDIDFESHIAAVDTVVDLYDSHANAVVTGDGYFEQDRFDIVIEVTEPNVESTTYVIHAKRVTLSGYDKSLQFNGNVQSIVIPYDHDYFLQAWGAQGGRDGGRGGYSEGTIYLEKGTILYAYAGGSGDSGGFNGGGGSKAGKGGGASDIRIGTDSLYARVLVAGGGGGHGSDGCASGGAGGGLNGGGKASSGSCGIQAGGGSQTEGGTFGKYSNNTGYLGKFGIGATSSNNGGSWYGGGGGGGWYGGGSGSTGGWSNGGGGGSGFIYTPETANTIEANESWLLDSKYYLTNAKTMSGTATFESVNGKTETGHAGNGFVRVSIPYQNSENNYLDGIIANKGVMTPEWDYNTDTYHLQLAPDEVEVNIEGVPADGRASVAGNGDFIIEAGTTEIVLIVTAENGYTKTYKVIVEREADTNSKPNDILINGLLDTYCSTLEGACLYRFNPDTESYYVTVPYTIREIVMVVDKSHYFQTVMGDGLYELDGGETEFDVSVTSEDKSNTSNYHYTIFRDMTGNNDLKILKLKNPDYDINYSFNVTTYYVTVPTETTSVELEAIPDDENAGVNIIYPEGELEFGENVVTVRVTAANNAVKDYIVVVNRLRSNNAFMSELHMFDTTNGIHDEIPITPTFNKMNLRYEINVENETSKISFEGALEGENSTTDGFRDYNLNVGTNTINITVTAQDESTLTYTVIVNRKPNSNSLLSDLYIENINLTDTFDKNKFVYYAYVTGEVESLNVIAVPESSTSTYRVIGDAGRLIAGKNELTVRVTAEDGSYNDYKLIVNRTGYDDNYLQTLIVQNSNETYILTPTFDPLYETYRLHVPNDVTDLTITAIANGSKRATIDNSSVFIKNINLLNDNPSNTSIVVTAEDGNVRTYTLEITRELSNDNTLSSLTVEGNELIPEFNPLVSEYSFTTNDRVLNIDAVPNNRFARIRVTSNTRSLTNGLNVIVISVTSETGITRDYTLNVTRIPSDDNTLKRLEVPGEALDPIFDPLTEDYSFTTFMDSINLITEANNQYATIKVNGSKNLVYGENIIEIVVTSETGIPKTYTLTIDRKMDENNYLSGLTTSAGINETFNREDTMYTVTTDKREISITATLESRFANYQITDSSGNVVDPSKVSLVLGDNLFNILVTAQNGDTKLYQLNVTKILSNDSKLSNLTTSVGNTVESFNPDSNSYTVITTENSLKILPETRSPYATYSIMNMNGDVLDDGNTSLVVGLNGFLITVTAEDGSTSMYSLTITRNKKNIATIDSVPFETEPKFNKDTFSGYYVVVDESALNLNGMVLTDPNATYRVEGNSELSKDHTNTVRIFVTSEDESITNTYTFTVSRTTSKDARLGKLTLGNYEFKPSFDKDTNSYQVFVPNGTTFARLETETLKNTATIKSIDVNGTSVSVNGTNIFDDIIEFNSIDIYTDATITIVSKAENGDELTYTFTIMSEDKLNNYLSNITVSCGNLTPSFDKDINEYLVWVDETVNSCTINATSEIPDVLVTGTGTHNYPLEDKYLIVPIEVTNGIGEIRTYEVKIRRPLSGESRLESLGIEGATFTPSFDKDTHEYTVSVPFQVSALYKDVFEYVGVDPDVQVDFKEVNLPVGEEVTYVINTLSEDGNNTSKYTLKVTRELNTSTVVPSVEAVVGTGKYICEINPDTNECTLGVPSYTNQFILHAVLPEGATTNPSNPMNVTMGSDLYSKDVTFQVTAQDGVHTDNYTVHIVRNLSTNNGLTDLKLNGVTVPGFSKDKLEYEKTVIGTINQGVVSVTLDDDKATVVTDISRPFPLEYGENTIEIVIRSESGEENTYTIKVTRSDSTDATLSSLSVKGYPFLENFEPEEVNYTIRVPRSKTSLSRSEILYTINDPVASITIPDNVLIDFSRPTNVFSITVTAGDGVVQKTYHINILPELSKNNKVVSITIDGEVITPENNTFTYGMFEMDSMANLTEIILEDEYAVHTLAIPTTLNYGEDKTFTVTSESGDVQVYTINLVKTKTRLTKVDNIEFLFKPTDDCEGICTLDRKFDEDIQDYTITIPNELNRLETIIVTTKNDHQTYEIIGNEDLQVGENTVIIRVKNTLGETLDYNFKVIREPNTDSRLLGIRFTTPELEVPDFDENTYEYFVEFNGISSGTLRLEVDKKSEGDSVSIGGSKVLYYGKNDIIIRTESESCSYPEIKTRGGCNQSTYVVHAYRNQEYSNLLQSLTVSSGDSGDLLQVFNKFKFDYVFEVDSEINKIKIAGTAQNTEHTEVIGNGEYNLKNGLNTFQVIVKPEVGDAQTYTLNIIRSTGGNVNLANLSVNGYELNPEYQRNVIDYYLGVSEFVRSLDIIYEKEDPSQTVHITGNSNFIAGENLVNVIVLSADKTRAKTYTIHVNRSASDNNLLNSLVVTSMKDDINTSHILDPSFASGINEYTVIVDKDIRTVNINATKGESKQRINGLGDYTLDYGENIIPITVTSESGIINTYTVKVIREFNYDLDYITVKNGEDVYPLSPNLTSGVYEYEVNVPHEIDNVIVDASLSESLNTLEGIGEYDLNTGNNEIVLRVKYLDKGTKEYKINIIRAASSDNNLEDLQIGEGVIDPLFDPETLNYTVDIPFEYDKVSVIYTTSDENATVEILNNENLEIGVPKDIGIKVTAEDGTPKTYTVTVTRLPEPTATNKLADMYIDEGTLEPLFTTSLMNYNVDVSKDTTRATLHLKAEEPLYTSVEVYLLGTTNLTKVDMKVKDPRVLLNLQYGRNTYIIKVTNSAGSIRNYQLNIWRSGPNEARIKSLTFNEGVLKERFDKNKYSYTMDVDTSVTSLTEVITMVDPLATYKISGNKNLKAGENIITIITTAQDGREHLEYTVVVNKKASSNAFLSDIVTFPEKDFTFDKQKYYYTFHVGENVNTVQIIGIREDMKATLTGNGIYMIGNEDKEIALTVVAEDGTTRIYTVLVTKDKESNTNLGELTINNGELVPSFDKDITEYTVDVDDYVDSITIHGTPESDKSTISGNGTYDLVEGENRISIIVTGEDGSTKEYIIIVNKKPEELEETSLEDLYVVEGELKPSFSPYIKDYVVNIPNEYVTATVVYTPHNKDAIVDIYDNGDLEVGHNLITIKVTVGEESSIYTIDAIRQDASNTYLSDLYVNNYSISPTFDKTLLMYSLNLGSEVNSIDVKATPEINTSSVYIKNNNEEYKQIDGLTNVSLVSGTNNISFKVVSSTGAERVYKLVVTREVSDENKLLTLNASTGEFNVKFDPDVKEYILSVPVLTESVTLSGTVSDYATVGGLDTYQVNLGSKTEFITVTSQSGKVNMYQVTIIREADTDAGIINIIPSEGTLDPVYNEDTEIYNMTVEGDLNQISFDVTTRSKFAKVTGNGNTNLFPGNNTITIISTAEDGVTTKTVTIEVYKKLDVTGILVEDVSIPVGADYQLEVKYIPEDTDYKGVTFEVEDPTILTITPDGLITPLKTGETKIKVTSTRNHFVTTEATITVINPLIESDVYYINRDGEIPYVTGMATRETIDEFLDNFVNDRENLKLYDKDETFEIAYEEWVATKMVLKLEINGIVYDELVLVLKGDIDGDGFVNVFDVDLMKNNIAHFVKFDSIELEAADIDLDGFVNVFDVDLSKNFIAHYVTDLNEYVKDLMEEQG